MHLQIRRASTSPSVAQASYLGRNTAVRSKNLLYGSLILILSGGGFYYATDTRASIHQYILPRLIRRLYPDAEDGHYSTIKLLSKLHALSIGPRERESVPSSPETEITDLTTHAWETQLSNPIAISAGLDKQGEAIDALFALGPSILEIGAITPKPQEGNARPRAFRITSQQAAINRYGCNSDGADAVAGRLRDRLRRWAYEAGFGSGEVAEQRVLDGEAGVSPGSLREGTLLAVQVAKNKETDEKDVEAVTRDYREAVAKLARYADVITINVSSPNTAGLRDLQKGEVLQKILGGVVGECRAVRRKVRVRVMVKVSPDEDSEEQIRGVCDAVSATDVDGVIVANTTITRPVSQPDSYYLLPKERELMQESGGFSGPQLFDHTLDLVSRYRAALDAQAMRRRDAERKVIWASGGITDGRRALRVLGAGADVAMVYTAMSYGGAGTITRIKDEMRREIEADMEVD